MARSFWEELERRRSVWDVLEHPFYRRWRAGGLSAGELVVYASEYDHLVGSIACASRRTADLLDGALGDHAAEEEEHVRLWWAFAKAVGWNGWGAWAYAEEPLPATSRCAAVWTGGSSRGLPEHLVTLYAIESAQPAICEAKLFGLLHHYGFVDGPATEYLRLHSTLDHLHAALIKTQLEQVMNDVDPGQLLDQVEAVQRSYWLLLDGLEAVATA